MAGILHPRASLTGPLMYNKHIEKIIPIHSEYTIKQRTSPISMLSILENQLPRGFQDLPQNILVRIFSFFSEKELSGVIAGVCSNWHKATRHPVLWRHLEFKGGNVSTAVICQMLRSSPLLETLRLEEVPNVATIIRQLCRCNAGIRHLAAKYCTTKKDELVPETVLKNLITSCSKIVSLDFQGTQFQTQRVFQELAHLSELKSLNLGMNRFLLVENLVDVAMNCRGLQELKLSCRRTRHGKAMLTDHDAVFILSYLKRSLTVLKFDMSGLSDPSYEAILNCRHLRHLSLNNALQFPNDMFRNLAIQLTHVTKLKLGHACKLRTQDFIYLFSKYGHVMEKLVKLDITGCWGVADSGLKSIVDACSKNLEFLSVKCCKSLTNEGVEYIVHHCKKLEYLNMAHTVRINADILSEIPLTMPKLKTLIIDRDESKHNVLRSLKVNMKHLEINESLSEYSRKEKPFLT